MHLTNYLYSFLTHTPYNKCLCHWSDQFSALGLTVVCEKSSVTIIHVSSLCPRTEYQCLEHDHLSAPISDNELPCYKMMAIFTSNKKTLRVMLLQLLLQSTLLESIYDVVCQNFQQTLNCAKPLFWLKMYVS